MSDKLSLARPMKTGQGERGAGGGRGPDRRSGSEGVADRRRGRGCPRLAEADALIIVSNAEAQAAGMIEEAQKRVASIIDRTRPRSTKAMKRWPRLAPLAEVSAELAQRQEDSPRSTPASTVPRPS